MTAHEAKSTLTENDNSSAQKNVISQNVNKLNKSHIDQVTKKRGLPLSFCEVNCRSVNATEASELLGYPAQSGGIWLEGDNYQGQFRPDTPWKSDGEKKAPKYRSSLGEYDAMLPSHPEDSSYWEDLKALHTYCYVIDGTLRIVITEGLFKALAGLVIGIPTISLLGVEMGLTGAAHDIQGKRYLVSALERFAREGFGFIHAFDADSATNNAVVLAQRKLCAQIARFNLPQYIVAGLWTVDQGKGMDDYIQKHGGDAFRRILSGAISIEKWEAQFATSDDETKRVSQQSLSMDVIDKYREVLAWHVRNQAWYWYEQPIDKSPIRGVWAEVADEDIGHLIVTEAMTKLTHFNHDLIGGAKRLLKYHLKVNQWETMPGYVCLKDCVLDLATGEEHPHQPGYRFLSALPYNWKDRAIGCDPIKEWLLQICDNRRDWVEVLRAAMNATVTERGGRLQRFIELVGFGGSGKGTVIRLVTALVGTSHVANTDLKQLEKNRFETASLYGKKAIIISDSERYAGEVATLKSLTGQDLIRYEKKGVQQTQGYRYDGMVWIAANEAIQSADYTSGMKRRRLSIPFHKVVPPHLRRDLEVEFAPFLPGLLEWVLAMPEAEVIDYIQNTSAKVPSLQEFQAEILLETNPIASWADYALVINPTTKTYVGNKGMSNEYYLYANYCNWAETAGYQAMSQARFSGNLLDLLESQLGIAEVRRDRDSKGNYLKGVAIRTPGMDSWPRLISGDKQHTKGDGQQDGFLPTQESSQLMPQNGYEKSDVSGDEKTLAETSSNMSAKFIDPPASFTDPPVLEGNGQDQVASPPLASPAQTQAQRELELNTLTITEGNSSRHSYSLLDALLAVWENLYELGEVVLKSKEADLLEATRAMNTADIEHLKKAANAAWKLGPSRNAVYKMERVEIINADQTRDVMVLTKGGSKIKVKRGDLTPWLGLE